MRVVDSNYGYVKVELTKEEVYRALCKYIVSEGVALSNNINANFTFRRDDKRCATGEIHHD